MGIPENSPLGRAVLKAAGLAPATRPNPPRPRKCPEYHPGPAGDTFWLIRIPGWHPARVNQLYAGHWGKRARLKKDDRDLVAAYCRMAGVPKATGKRRVSLTIVLGPRQRAGDCDAFWKSTLDAIVRCGALRDDNRQWCELAPVRFERGQKKATIIGIEECK